MGRLRNNVASQKNQGRRQAEGQVTRGPPEHASGVRAGQRGAGTSGCEGERSAAPAPLLRPRPQEGRPLCHSPVRRLGRRRCGH
eukprot:496959-Alexandrium_andersonii.AAC.1